MLKKLLILAAVSTACLAQDYDEYQPPARQSSGQSRFAQAQEQPKQAAPIAILKQINKHNEDGSYTYGYEGADGSFKIETKTADGEVKGKYGYIDGEGKVKTVEYGANKYGFQPSGEGITVAPIDFNAVREDEIDYENQQQQFIQRPKAAPKASRPQSFDNFGPQVVEKRKPAFAPTQAPQYYDYEEETQRPIQTARPKYSAPQQQFAPQPQRQQQFGADAGIVYAPQARTPAPQYQQFENRQPVQFPAEPASQLNTRTDQFSLFSPASQRADTFKSKFDQLAQEPFHSQFANPPQPQPSPQAQPAYQRPSFAPQPSQSRNTVSVLDQLAKDPNYVLPQSSPALHDISFGYSV